MKKSNKLTQPQNMNVTIRKVSENNYEIVYFNIDNDKVIKSDQKSSLKIWVEDFKSRGHIVTFI